MLITLMGGSIPVLEEGKGGLIIKWSGVKVCWERVLNFFFPISGFALWQYSSELPDHVTSHPVSPHRSFFTFNGFPEMTVS